MGVSGARDRGEENLSERSLLQLFLSERGDFTFICTRTNWGNVTRTDRKAGLLHWSQGAADNTNTRDGGERFSCLGLSPAARSPLMRSPHKCCIPVYKHLPAILMSQVTFVILSCKITFFTSFKSNRCEVSPIIDRRPLTPWVLQLWRIVSPEQKVLKRTVGLAKRGKDDLQKKPVNCL